MAQIQPVQIWKNGQIKVAEEFNLLSVSDNLSSAAQFYYELKEATVTDADGNQSGGEILSSGNLSMAGQEYQDWDDSNASAYSWAAGNLGLTIV